MTARHWALSQVSSDLSLTFPKSQLTFCHKQTDVASSRRPSRDWVLSQRSCDPKGQKKRELYKDTNQAREQAVLWGQATALLDY